MLALVVVVVRAAVVVEVAVAVIGVDPKFRVGIDLGGLGAGPADLGLAAVAPILRVADLWRCSPSGI